jgi:hypothetical protein
MKILTVIICGIALWSMWTIFTGYLNSITKEGKNEQQPKGKSPKDQAK